MAITWLEQPSNMTWMRLEADDFGFLDDVAVLRSDGTLCLNQIKHVTERPKRLGLSVDDLLEKDGKKSRSLFQKWFQSWLSVEADPAYIRVEVIVHANRPPAENLAALFCKNPPLKIDPALLRSENPTAFASFLEQAGDDAVRLDDFLNTVAFRLNSPDIEPTEEALKERAKFLNIGDEGFRALSDKIYEWSTRKGEDRKTVRITLDAVKQACGWRKGERLSEEFPVAPDYIPLGGYALQAFTNKVLSYDAGEFLLSDVPGAGKSTFLAKLYSHLDANGVPCVRHHYFLSGDDDAKYPRLNAKRTADAIVAELEAFVSISISASLEKLRDILACAAAELHGQKRKLVLLLDGLDHVLRDDDEEELEAILKQLLPVPPNLLIVFGSREGLSARVRNLLQHVPSDRQYHVPRMTAEDCKAMLLAHPAIQVPEHALDAVSSRLASITEGLPLHAHYCMVQLEDLSQQGFIFEHDLDQLVPYGGDLKAYYEAIWLPLTAETKVLATALAIAEFPVPRKALPLLFQGNLIDLQRAVERLRPFVNEGVKGFTLFHASFQEFVSAHPDTDALRGPSLERLISWLKNHASVRLRWRWLHAKEWEAGNAQPLLEATHRDWVIDSIRKGHSPYAVEELLRLACDAAMRQSEYGVAMDRAMSAGQLDFNLSTDDTFWSDSLSLAGFQRLDRETGAPRFLDFRYENSDVLVELARRAPAETLPEIEEELFDRFESIAYAKRVNSYETAVEGAARYYLEVLVFIRKPIREVASFIGRFRSEPGRFAVASDYVEALLRSKQYTNARSAVEQLPVTEAHRSMLNEKIAFACIAKRGVPFSSVSGTGLWSQLCERLVGQGMETPRYQWPSGEQLPASVQRYNEDDRYLVASSLHSAWLNGLLAGVVDDPSSLQSWKAGVRSLGWTGRTASHLASAGYEMGACLARTGTDLSLALAKFDEVELMRPGDVGWDDYELWIGYKRAITNILRDVLALRYRWQDTMLDDAALARVAAISGLEEHDHYKLLLSCEPEMLVRSVVESFTAHRLRSLDTLLEEFPQRAEFYLEVAKLARRVGASDLSQACLRHAIDNLLGYGNHKDIFLHELLQSLDFAAKHRPVEAKAMLSRVAPIVNAIRKVTDGDETSHLIENFTEISMQNGTSAIAGAVYVQMAGDERYYEADKIFSKLAECGDLSNVWVQALLRTAIDRSARHYLVKRAQQDSDAASLVAAMESVDHDSALEIVKSGEATTETPRQERGLDLFESVTRTTAPDEIKPSEFLAFCTTHQRDHHVEQFVERWWDCWVLKDRKGAHDAVTEALNQRVIRSWSGNLELRLLPTVFEFDGDHRAFEVLIDAARAVHVWNSFYTSFEKTKTIFEFLLGHFPKRIDEFIQRSVELEGYRRRLGALSVRRGSQFLFEAGRADEAIKLVTTGVNRLISLMANLTIPDVEWSFDEANLLNALFARLFHVHPEVRSRAAQSLGDLLLRPETVPIVRAELEKRMTACVLESELVTLLYPVAYARRRGYVWPNAELAPLLHARSAASDMVLAGGAS